MEILLIYFWYKLNNKMEVGDPVAEGSEKVTLTTQDGEKVEVDKEIATKSKLVQGIVDESPDEEIPLPSVKKATLDKILEFMTYEH